jgi:hypothetical protein
MLVEKGYRAATLSDRRCPVLSVVVGWDVAPMWPQRSVQAAHPRLTIRAAMLSRVRRAAADRSVNPLVMPL